MGTTVPSTRKFGLVIPGLGHLLEGKLLDGLGLISYLLVLAWALGSGAGRIGALLFPSAAAGGFHLHPWIGLFCGLATAVVCWWVAWRFANPLQAQESDKSSNWKDFKKQFVKNRVGVFGMHLVNCLILLALLTPFIAPFDPDQIDVGGQRLAPQLGYLMGTDEFGRDVFSRVMYGARISLSIGFIAVTLSASIGTIVGAVAGYFGGTTDKALMWFVDLLLSMPRLVLLLAIVGFFRTSGAQSIFLIVVILGLTGWMGVSRIVRSQVLSLKEQDFIQAGRALGLSNLRIIFNHLVPNAMAPVIVYSSLAIGSTILVEAALSFLGLGVPPPTSTWGAIVNDGREYMRSAPWITISPGLMIVMAVMAFNLFGDGLRDALDPRLRGR